jgi:riboflavin synthase alpha subunit
VINPRKLVQAQLTLAAKQGCHIVDGHVVHVARLTESGSKHYYIHISIEQK